MTGRVLGLIVNPLAGIGGRLGFKGSDGAYGVRALMMGAELVAPRRTRAFLEALDDALDHLGSEVRLLMPPGRMGASIVGEMHRLRHIAVEAVPCVDPRIWPTTAHDTVRCARALQDRVDLLIFVGGDGTARDILNAVDMRLPVLGIPSGVKVYSSVFAVNPQAAARVVIAFLEGRARLEERLVVDVDEEEFRRDRLVLRTFGKLLVPAAEGVVESPKTMGGGEGVEDIARFFADELYRDCTLYILGPGQTVARIAEYLGVKKTLLGVDALHNRRLVGRDLDEKSLLELTERYPRSVLVLSPIGGQGFILGRG
ncbi:ATP-NAD kinase family protein [Aeropyrum camini]|nr:ATP-NAD kinase family protein [Aeropyrum camini]